MQDIRHAFYEPICHNTLWLCLEVVLFLVLPRCHVIFVLPWSLFASVASSFPAGSSLLQTSNVVCREGGDVYVNNFRLLSGSRIPNIIRVERRPSLQCWQRSAMLAISRQAMYNWSNGSPSSCWRSSSAILSSATFRSWIRSKIAVTVILSSLSMPKANCNVARISIERLVRSMALCWRAGRRSSCSSSTKSSHDRLHAASSRNVLSAVIGSGGLVLACGPVEVRWTLVSVR